MAISFICFVRRKTHIERHVKVSVCPTFSINAELTVVFIICISEFHPLVYIVHVRFFEFYLLMTSKFEIIWRSR